MSNVDDYVEKVILDAYKQTLSDEENVPRSLPFFAAVLALLAATGAAMRDYIPAPGLAPYPAFVWLCITLGAVAVAKSLWSLFIAVRKRSFEYPMTPNELLGHVDQLRAYYEGELPERARAAAVVAAAREDYLKQVSDAATNNKLINDSRMTARGDALQSLLVALALTFILIITITIGTKVAVHDQPTSKPAATRTTDSRSQPGSATSRAAGATYCGEGCRGANPVADKIGASLQAAPAETPKTSASNRGASEHPIPIPKPKPASR